MIEFFTKPWPIPMPKKAWKIFGMLLANLRYKQVKRGEPQMNGPQLVGAIVAQYVLKRSRQIREEFARNEAEYLSATPLPNFYTPAELADIRAASAEQVPDAIRAGSERRRAHNRRTQGPRWSLRGYGR